jgi:hypothetical protein
MESDPAIERNFQAEANCFGDQHGPDAEEPRRDCKTLDIPGRRFHVIHVDNLLIGKLARLRES